MKTNIGKADRIARFLIALLALGLYSSHSFSGIAANVMLLFGIIMLVTAYFSFCPLYKLIGFSTYKPEADFMKLMEENTVIVDVRQPGEYNAGHIEGSINIPLDQLASNLSKLAGRTVITCCASGVRSAAAKDVLAAAGIKAFNGGGWKSLSEQFVSPKD
jgi:rhodanese-related sulfurtransferase